MLAPVRLSELSAMVEELPEDCQADTYLHPYIGLDPCGEGQSFNMAVFELTDYGWQLCNPLLLDGEAG